jgi:hypothetical protein
MGPPEKSDQSELGFQASPKVELFSGVFSLTVRRVYLYYIGAPKNGEVDYYG